MQSLIPIGILALSALSQASPFSKDQTGFGLESPSDPETSFPIAAGLHKRSPQSFKVESNYPKDPLQAHWAPITIGGQNLAVFLDTGSDSLVVFAEQQGSPAFPSRIPNTTIFQPSESMTFKNQSAPFTSRYAAGQVSGTLGTDDVALGGSDPASQAVGVVPYSAQYKSPYWQGILGLGPNDVGINGWPSFHKNLLPNLPSPLFTMYINATGTGHWNFGALDSTQYTGPIKYTSPDQRPQCQSFYGPLCWTVANLNILFQGYQHTQQSCMIVDTGSIFTLLDDDTVNAYYSVVKGATRTNGLWFYPCDAHPQDMVFDFGQGAKVTLPGEQMSITNNGQGLCQGLVQSNEAAGGIGILSYAFMKAQMAVFSYANKTVGFAEIAPKAP